MGIIRTKFPLRSLNGGGDDDDSLEIILYDRVRAQVAAVATGRTRCALRVRGNSVL